MSRHPHPERSEVDRVRPLGEGVDEERSSTAVVAFGGLFTAAAAGLVSAGTIEPPLWLSTVTGVTPRVRPVARRPPRKHWERSEPWS